MSLTCFVAGVLEVLRSYCSHIFKSAWVEKYCVTRFCERDTMEKNRLKYIDLLKGIGIICVIQEA